MPRSIQRLTYLGLVALLAACDRGTPGAKDASPQAPGAAARPANAGAKKAQPGQAKGAPGRAKVDSGPPFEDVAGYVVRGTDESSFRRCGSTRTHYIRASGESAVNLAQRYRFRANAPLSPVYFRFRARVLEDTVSVGDYTYTSVLDVRRVLPEKPGESPECPAPMRGSMIAER